ncbi:MAG: ribosome rescue protein RqcH [Candidatus Thalassarchaeaceae archaeon]|nr:ribosome rescue protein RqcH [Candidatus Thalassarchaeaceae archaeon]
MPSYTRDMRAQSSSFDVARIVDELRGMIGVRARKAYQPHYEQVVLRLNQKGKPSTDLVIVRGKRIYLSQRDRPMPTNPSPFAMKLRKHLSNSRLIEVNQLGFDRVISLTFEHGRGRLKLIIELFRDGNVLLLDDKDVIIQPLTHAKYASRSLKSGENYTPPPATVDPRNLNRAELDELLDSSDHSLIRTLAARVNLGRIYGNAIATSAGIELDEPANSLDKEQRKDLGDSMKKLLAELTNGDCSYLWFTDIKSLDAWKEAADNPMARDSASVEIEEFSPIALPFMNTELMVEIESLSGAYDAIFGAHDAIAYIRREEEKLVAAGEDEEEQRAKLNRRAEQQKSAITRFESQAVLTQELAKSIQDNWTHVDDLLSQVNSFIEADSWQALESKTGEIVWIDRVEPAKRTILARLPDEDNEPGASVTLHIEKSVHQNAQQYFEQARTLKDKAKGARTALERTENAAAKEEARRKKDAAAGKVRIAKRSKRFWFEKHRWGILSDGRLVVGGRDAKGNDTIVRKYLKSTDLYIHADLHGAPSCSLRLRDGLITDENPIGFVPEGVTSLRIAQELAGDIDDAQNLPANIIEEAAQLAICWSRAWGSGGAAATAFHARPSQVSKQTESGESLGRGSFVVRGQRTWYRDVSMEIAIGFSIINGIPIPVSGTAEGVSKLCERWALITPGREKKETIANRIAKSTGLAQDDVLAALPPGNCSIENHGLIQS